MRDSRIRSVRETDWDVIWLMLEPIIRAGEVFALPIQMRELEAQGYWFAEGNRVFVVEENDKILGSYYLRPNQRGGGSHIANCGYLTASEALGRGLASQMCAHSIDLARSLGFSGMQFNFVVSTNHAAVHLWQKHGFKIIATLPGAFRHPKRGFVDAFVMWRQLY